MDLCWVCSRLASHLLFQLLVRRKTMQFHSKVLTYNRLATQQTQQGASPRLIYQLRLQAQPQRATTCWHVNNLVVEPSLSPCPSPCPSPSPSLGGSCSLGRKAKVRNASNNSNKTCKNSTRDWGRVDCQMPRKCQDVATEDHRMKFPRNLHK